MGLGMIRRNDRLAGDADDADGEPVLLERLVRYTCRVAVVV